MPSNKTATLVVERFLNHQAGRSANLSTDGLSLHSYAMQIAQWNMEKVEVVGSETIPTATTRRHYDTLLALLEGRGITHETKTQESA